MNLKTYDQLPVSREVVGTVAPYLKENMNIFVEFYGDRPVNIMFPEKVSLKVTSCPPGVHATDSTTMKRATLENNMEILVPQFIKEGDEVVVDVSSGKYVDRVKKS